MNTLPPGLLRDFILRGGAPFAEHSLQYADVDPTAWEGAIAEIRARRQTGLPVPKPLADFACDVATGRAVKPESDKRAGYMLRDWKIRAAVRILMLGGVSERAAQRYVGNEIDRSYEAIASVCRSA